VPDDVIDFTPELRKEGLENLKRYKWVNSPYVPLIAGDVNGLLGTINLGNTSGGTNWPGAGFDPETNIFYTQASNSSLTTGSLAEPPAGFSDIRYLAGVKGREFREVEGPGFGDAADAPRRREPPRPAGGGGAVQPAFRGIGPQGLPIIKPPYGVVSAIQLDKGELLWQVPHGDTPDTIRNHPLLKGMNIPKTGQTGSVGVLVTKTLVIAGDPQVTTTPEHPRGAMMRAYDKASGKEVGAVLMPTLTSGSPMTYSVDGKQYIVIAVSGGAYSGEYIAFALPTEENETHSSQEARTR